MPHLRDDETEPITDPNPLIEGNIEDLPAIPFLTQQPTSLADVTADLDPNILEAGKAAFDVGSGGGVSKSAQEEAIQSDKPEAAANKFNNPDDVKIFNQEVNKVFKDAGVSKTQGFGESIGRLLTSNRGGLFNFQARERERLFQLGAANARSIIENRRRSEQTPSPQGAVDLLGPEFEAQLGPGAFEQAQGPADITGEFPTTLRQEGHLTDPANIARFEEERKVQLARAEDAPFEEFELDKIRVKADATKKDFREDIQVGNKNLVALFNADGTFKRIVGEKGRDPKTPDEKRKAKANADSATREVINKVGIINAQIEVTGRLDSRNEDGTPNLVVVSEIAKGNGVRVDDVLKALKDPNAAGVTINLPKPATGGERQDIADARSKLRQLKNIKATFKKGFVGIFDEKTGRVKSATGFISPAHADFRTAVELAKTEVRHFYFGSQLPQQEMDEAMRIIPNLTMSDVQFISSIDGSIKILEGYVAERVGVIEESGLRIRGDRPVAPKNLAVSEDAREAQLRKEHPDWTDEQVFTQMLNEGF